MIIPETIIGHYFYRLYFFSIMIINGRESTRAALKLAFLGALRINELVGLKHEDIIIDVEVNMLMDLPNKMHRSKNPTTQPPWVQKPVLDPTAVEIILAARTAKHHGEYLFPPGIWREKMARDAVKAWAAEHAMEFLGDIANVFLDGAGAGGSGLRRWRALAAVAGAGGRGWRRCWPWRWRARWRARMALAEVAGTAQAANGSVLGLYRGGAG